MTIMLVEDILALDEQTIKNHLSEENIEIIQKHFGNINNFLDSYQEKANLSLDLYFSEPKTYLKKLAPNLTNTRRVIVKKVGEEPKIVEIDKEQDFYKFKRQVVNGTIECIEMDSNIECWVNENGKPLHLPINFPFRPGADIVVGDVIFCNNDNELIGLSDTQISQVLAYLKVVGYDWSKVEYDPDDYIHIKVMDWSL
ncbi:DUF3846 domain-containing protein (plasmid) [Mycoplasmatota bacterium]|nr:DUF3846 domain-containing protein [Mycoplasmatota bacterium]